MAMQTEVEINSINVDDYLTAWEVEEDWGDAEISEATLTFSRNVESVVVPETGMTITIKRGFTNPDDSFVFQGEITQVKPESGIFIKLVCKDPLNDAIKNRRVKSWDRNVDVEEGVGSEIFKDIASHSGLDYDDITVPSTGLNETDRIIKFVQTDEDNFQKMKELAQLYNKIIRWEPSDQKVHFTDRGDYIYPVTLLVGEHITRQMRWTENMEQLINKVKIYGATVYDKVVEEFDGPDTEFTLSKTPEDTEVRINSSTTNDLQVRGQKDVGIIGTDFDYYVDVEQKKLVFGADVIELWINYGSQVPMPIVLQDPASINLYGGPNKIPHYKKFTFNNIKDISDAEDIGRSILQKYAYPVYQASDIPINTSTIETYGDIKPGYYVDINDTYNDRSKRVLVTSVTKSWPHISDRISVGPGIWKTEDWQMSQMEKINQLFNELSKNENILISTIDMYSPIEIERKSFAITRQKICDSFKWSHPINGLLTQGGYISDYFGNVNHSVNCSYATNLDPTYIKAGASSIRIHTVTSSASFRIDYNIDPATVDISRFSGITSGSPPTKGTIGCWIYTTEPTKFTGIYCSVGISGRMWQNLGITYDSFDGYENIATGSSTLRSGWNYLLFRFINGTLAGTGTPNWTAMKRVELIFLVSSAPTSDVYVSYHTISESLYIGLNGFGTRTQEVL